MGDCIKKLERKIASLLMVRDEWRINPYRSNKDVEAIEGEIQFFERKLIPLQRLQSSSLSGRGLKRYYKALSGEKRAEIA